ncbi:hypothetical protein ACFL5V_08440 [Fibrobacterota bacterium]
MFFYPPLCVLRHAIGLVPRDIIKPARQAGDRFLRSVIRIPLISLVLLHVLCGREMSEDGWDYISKYPDIVQVRNELKTAEDTAATGVYTSSFGSNITLNLGQ